MPKKTFYRISEDKQKRIIKAARDEFLSVPYSDVSINKIIKEAGIPRGSFYQYFDGKEDLFQYVLESQENKLSEILAREIERHHGDIFLCIQNNIDRVIEFAFHEKKEKRQIIFSESHVFETIRRTIMKCESSKDKVSVRLADKIDKNLLEVENEDELLLLMDILGLVVCDNICKIFLYNNQMTQEQIRKAFHAKIETLERHYRKHT